MGANTSAVEGSSVNVDQVPPPPCSDHLRSPHVSAPTSLPAGMVLKRHTSRPVCASYAMIRPRMPNSPPEMPTSTRPFQAIGADEMYSPMFGSPTMLVHSSRPF